MSISLDPLDPRDAQPWAAQRRDYAAGGLSESEAPADPIELFRRWHADATSALLPEPNAMVIATVSSTGAPSSRMVLLRRLDERGFGFFTNVASRKGAEIAGNQAVALLFPWHGLERQVRVEGAATALPRDEVAAYFHSRPRGAQLGAWASHQSRPVASRAEIETAQVAVTERFAADEVVPVPDEWGGYVVHPEAIEFWQGRSNRLHDRLLYTRTGDAWARTRLQP